MAFTLEQIVPWGRSLDEYERMFDLSLTDLCGKILDCGGGPASFTAEMTALGRQAVAVDPIYVFSCSQIKQRIDETYSTILSQLYQNLHDYVWKEFKDPEALGAQRRRAMQGFLDDYATGQAAGRYQTGALPTLNFADQSFDLALCSHLLLLYSAQLSYEFHVASIQELCRVAREVRIFPLLNLACQPSPYLQPLQDHFRAAGYAVALCPVPYEFQRGSNRMMKIHRPSPIVYRPPSMVLPTRNKQ